MNTHNKEIIRFLSEEMSLNEQEAFELRLEQDKELYREYDTIKQVWDTLREQLSINDEEGPSDLDERIARVMADHDYNQLKDLRPGAGEKKFKETLEHFRDTKQDSPAKLKNNRKIVSFSIIAAAAAIALLIIIPGANLEELLSAYSDPANDQLVMNLANQTRSDEADAGYYFSQGEYERVFGLLNPKSSNLSEHEKLYYAISLHELGKSNEAVNLLESLSGEIQNSFDQIVSWYLAIYLIQSGEKEKGSMYLEKLSAGENPYSKKAVRLLRRI